MPQPARKGDAFIHQERSREVAREGLTGPSGIVIPDAFSGTNLEPVSISGKAFFPGKIIIKEVQVFRECEQVFLSFLFES